MKKFHHFISLSRNVKRMILLLADSILLISALWISFSLRLGILYFPEKSEIIALILISPLIAFPIFIHFGLYRAIIRYLGMQAAWSIIQAVSLYAVLWGLLALLSSISGIPRSVVLINALVTLLLIGGSRAMMRWMLNQWQNDRGKENEKIRTRAIIFGAGEAGRQLAVGLSHSREYLLCGFVDDAHEIQGREMLGLPILSLEQLPKFLEQHLVTDLFLAIPSVSRQQRNQILDRIRPFPLRVRTLPGLVALAKGDHKLSELHDLEIEDLLARPPALPDASMLEQQVIGQVILVTGAGGSIGSEICRQILRRQPKLLLLFDQNEFALYTIHSELLLLLNKLFTEERQLGSLALVPKLIPLLGSVQNEKRLHEVMKTWKPSVIYHTAAYKHVPLVESNVTEGVKNNVLGTLSLVKCAIEHQVTSLVLISTDKAVRPTNIMGCTKRIAEMMLQALAEKKELEFESLGKRTILLTRKTHLSMVRFGNVLGSSGSVVPLFRKQIKAGGPITLTHQDITRYFMTIPEAAQLVMQAGAMAKDIDAAEVFVLDMGDPVKIFDLAQRMIELSGYRVKNEQNPNGDIEIQIIGLRPGEKLYEELLIGNNPRETEHPRIMKAHEHFISWEELQPQLRKLQLAAENGEIEKIRNLMQLLVTDYTPEKNVTDSVYSEQIKQ